VKTKNHAFEGSASLMQETTKEALFSLGQLVATHGALASLAKAGQTPLEFLSRRVRGD